MKYLQTERVNAFSWTCKAATCQPQRDVWAQVPQLGNSDKSPLALRLWPELRAGALNPCISSPLALKILHRALQNHELHFKRGENWGTEVTYPQTCSVRKGVLISVNSPQHTAQDLLRKMSSECQVLIQPCWHFCSYFSLNPSAKSLSLLPAQPGVGQQQKNHIFLWRGGGKDKRKKIKSYWDWGCSASPYLVKMTFFHPFPVSGEDSPHENILKWISIGWSVTFGAGVGTGGPSSLHRPKQGIQVFGKVKGGDVVLQTSSFHQTT